LTKSPFQIWDGLFALIAPHFISREHLTHNVPVNIRHPTVHSVRTNSELFMVYSKELKNRRIHATSRKKIARIEALLLKLNFGSG
jgi:hypothetical protein